MVQRKFVSVPQIEEYSERFKDYYTFDRRDDGVLLVKGHTRGGPMLLSVEEHNSLWHMLKTVGADPKNEVLILSGTGDDFMMDVDENGFDLEVADMNYWSYEYAFHDGRMNVASLINDLEIPTIGLLNGPGFHSEIALMCDLTLCSDTAVIVDLHYGIGAAPGDGIHSCFQELLGVKRAAYALLTGEAIDAKTALEYGMVNEVVEKDKLEARAYTLADRIMTQPRTTRRLTTQIIRRPWRKRITDDLEMGFGVQLLGHLAHGDAVHGENHVKKSLEYVREGKKNAFDD